MLLARLEVDKGKETEDVSTGSWKKVVFDYRIWLLYASSVPSCSNPNTLSQDSPFLLCGFVSRFLELFQPDDPEPAWLDFPQSTSDDNTRLDSWNSGGVEFLLVQWPIEHEMALHFTSSVHFSCGLVHSLRAGSTTTGPIFCSVPHIFRHLRHYAPLYRTSHRKPERKSFEVIWHRYSARTGKLCKLRVVKYLHHPTSTQVSCWIWGWSWYHSPGISTHGACDAFVRRT